MDTKAVEAVLASIPASQKASMLKAMRGPNDPPFPPLAKKKPETIRVELIDPLGPRQPWFIRGPFSGEQFEIAARLPGKALAIWLLVHHQLRLRRKGGEEEITLPTALLERVGVDKFAKARALRHLVKAGLVTVTRQTGHSPRIRLREV
jgi:hypothetical protein